MLSIIKIEDLKEGDKMFVQGEGMREVDVSLDCGEFFEVTFDDGLSTEVDKGEDVVAERKA